MTPLASLLAAVKAGEPVNVSMSIDMLPNADKGWPLFYRAYCDESTDAAIALCGALLPEWTLSIGQNAHHKYWFAHLLKAENGAIVGDFGGQADTPARALLIAMLRALVAKEGACDEFNI